jgi:hypothetical protein
VSDNTHTPGLAEERLRKVVDTNQKEGARNIHRRLNICLYMYVCVLSVYRVKDKRVTEMKLEGDGEYLPSSKGCIHRNQFAFPSACAYIHAAYLHQTLRTTVY